MTAVARRVDPEWTRRKIGDVDVSYNIFFAATGCVLTAVFASLQLERLNAGHALVALAVTQPTTFANVVTLAVNVDKKAVHELIKAHPLAMPVVGKAQMVDSYSVEMAGQSYSPASLLYLDPDVYKRIVGKSAGMAKTVAEHHQRLMTVPVVYATAERVLNVIWPDWQRVVFNYRAVAELCGDSV